MRSRQRNAFGNCMKTGARPSTFPEIYARISETADSNVRLARAWRAKCTRRRRRRRRRRPKGANARARTRMKVLPEDVEGYLVSPVKEANIQHIPHRCRDSDRIGGIEAPPSSTSITLVKRSCFSFLKGRFPSSSSSLSHTHVFHFGELHRGLKLLYAREARVRTNERTKRGELPSFSTQSSCLPFAYGRNMLRYTRRTYTIDTFQSSRGEIQVPTCKYCKTGNCRI